MASVGLAEWIAAGRAIARRNLIRHEGTGHFTDRFEHGLSALTGARHVLTMTSGTNALVAALAAAGIGPGDEVLVPAYTWIATATAPLLVGAVPVLVEIDESLTMDPVDMARKITPHTRAVIPVHMGNSPANMDALLPIARRHGLVVVEDACQAVGVRYKDLHCGAMGDAGAFSFNGYKNINIGEGGALLTGDDALFVRARAWHDHGDPWRGHADRLNQPPVVGGSQRVSEVQGAMLGAQLAKLGPMLRRRQAWRAAVAQVLRRRADLRISPHHSEVNAVALNVIFATPAEAEAFAQRRGVTRVLDASGHIYTNWEAILAKRVIHPRMDPWAWAHRPIDYAPDMCPRTLDILARSCRIHLGQSYPARVAAVLATRLLLSPA